MKKTTSPYIVVKSSNIHNKGIFAKKFISEGTRVLEYVGDRITKKESDRRALLPLSRAKNSVKHGAVYIFELNKRHDIDGYVPYNTAKFINHSCSPNCETDIIRGHIWVIAIKDINKGDEITYNYGYNLEDYQDHPCKCGSDNCIGYILHEEFWPDFEKIMKKQNK